MRPRRARPMMITCALCRPAQDMLGSVTPENRVALANPSGLLFPRCTVNREKGRARGLFSDSG